MAELADAVFTAVRGYVDRELGKLALRFESEQRSAIAAIKLPERGEKGDKGDPGEPGAAALQVDVGALLADVFERLDARVDAAVLKMPKPEKGDKGEKGEKGDRGEPGDSIKGDKGDAGDRGPPGESVKGDKGDPGERGVPGESIRGEKGEPGQRGEPGDSIKGDKGDPGERGEPGLSVKGDPGERGDRGDAGLSAFQVAKASGFVGSEGEWLLSLHGRDGEDGDDGHRGEKGDPGRDALQIEIVAGIDITRSYPARTFAAFNGGTFYAMRETDPLQGVQQPALAGWHSLMVGIASDVETLEDGGRWRVRTLTLSNGTVSVQRQKTKMQINRGVYQTGRAYDEGDIVTFDGSMFTCQEETKERPKARDVTGPQAWSLCVKHGKDGRSSINGSGGRLQ